MNNQRNFEFGFANRRDEMRYNWMLYDRDHPEVWSEFKRIAFEMIRRGYHHGGAKAIVEIMRWERGKLGGDGENEFKLKAEHTSFYARKFAEEFPHHADFFRYRRQRSKDEPPTLREPPTPDDFPYIDPKEEN